jgi:hypothetical protein
VADPLACAWTLAGLAARLSLPVHSPGVAGGRLRTYHHLGIPTTERRPDERYLPAFGMHVSGYESSAFGVEWMRFDAGSPLPELVKTVPHVAFRVDDLDAAIAGHEVLIAPNRPSPGLRVAFIVENGAPIEFLEYDPSAGDALPEDES